MDTASPIPTEKAEIASFLDRAFFFWTPSPTRGRGFFAALALVIWPWTYFWRAALGQAVFFAGDLADFWYPTRVAFADALHAGGLPLWVRGMFGGFPLFAEMQTGALYPPHLLFYSLLPTELALNWDILFHLSWMGLGMFLLARRLRMGIAGAFFAALVLSFGGLAQARISHVNVLSTVAWLPWLLDGYEGWSANRNRPALAWLTLALAFVILLGHPQFALISFLLFALYILMRSGGVLPDPGTMNRRSPFSRDWIVVGVAGILAVLLSAVQVLPTLELARLSTRAAGQAADFGTSFSLHPLEIGLLLDPFVLGNPYPRVSVEITAYVGLLPLASALGALVTRRDRSVLFWGAVAAVGIFLSLGSYNPIYRVLIGELFPSLFRAPARFLLFTYLALALLAGYGLDRGLASLPGAGLILGRGVKAWSAGFVLLLVVVAGLAPNIAPDQWVVLWQLGALILGVGAIAGVLMARAHHLTRSVVVVLVLGGTALDLSLFGAVYAGTYNALVPAEEFQAKPRALDVLDRSPGQGRVYTSRWIQPWPAVMRQSLYPNLALAFGIESAPGYTPLTPSPVQSYLGALSQENFLDLPGHAAPADPCADTNRPSMSPGGLLDALSIRYYLIPQVLPATAACERADLFDPLGLKPGETIRFPPSIAQKIIVESSLAQSAGMGNGTPVADLVITLDQGEVITREILVGRDTAEWAYERSDVRAQIQHSFPPIASTFPARSAIPVESHAGHTYRGEFDLGSAVTIVAVRVQPRPGPAILHLSGIAFVSGDRATNVAAIAPVSDHRLIYRSEDVAVFENRDALPQARLVHKMDAASDAQALARMRQPDWDPRRENFIDGPALEGSPPQGVAETVRLTVEDERRVVVEVEASSEAYLILAHTWYPGWVARLDGAVEPIYRADVMFRAVRIPAGTHRVEFTYEPMSFTLGALVSGLTLLGLVAFTLFPRPKPR